MSDGTNGEKSFKCFIRILIGVTRVYLLDN